MNVCFQLFYIIICLRTLGINQCHMPTNWYGYEEKDRDEYEGRRRRAIDEKGGGHAARKKRFAFVLNIGP